jgi:hypothetical protein
MEMVTVAEAWCRLGIAGISDKPLSPQKTNALGLALRAFFHGDLIS